MAKNGFDDLGWESLDFMEEVQTTDEQKKKNSLYAKVFSSPEGQIVLQDLKSRTVEAASWFPGADEHYGYVREGQNSIVREILSRIERAKQN